MNNKKSASQKLLILGSLCILCSCASEGIKPTDKDTDRSPAQESQKIFTLLNNLNDRLETFDAKLNGINEKIDSTRLTLNHLSNTSSTEPTAVITHPSENSGTPTQNTPASHDPEVNFVNNNTIQQFRNGMMLYEGQKYPESVLSFSEFLEKSPDHPLAGSAQFYIGEAYMKQKEYKLALKEFERVLTSYDRSAHITDTLSEMATAEETLKNDGAAYKYRQLLTSYFPQSPAASNLEKLPPLVKTLTPESSDTVSPSPVPTEVEKPDSSENSTSEIPETAPIEATPQAAPSTLMNSDPPKQ